MKIIFCAYRDWALKVLPVVQKHPRISKVVHVTSNEQLKLHLKDHNWLQKTINQQTYDMVLFCGWSTPPEEELVNMGVPMFSEHPATTDRYSPGSPIQNQILDGIRYTKHRLVKVGFPELSPRQWSHEVDMDLSGNMSDILAQMEATSRQLFNMFLDDYPNISWNSWPELPIEEQVPRRTPEMSKMISRDFAQMSTQQLYDFIRGLESPYPNAYLEDSEGRLYFERVSFKKNDK